MALDRAAGPSNGGRRLFVYNGGFVTRPRERRILALAGWQISYGLPKPGDYVGVWGKSPTAHRGEAVATKREVPLLRVEDAFLRSLFPGPKGEPPLGLLIDSRGVHFDPSTPSDLEVLLATEPLDDTSLLDRARGAMALMQEAHITKYTAFDPAVQAPDPGYVLVIDQTRGDAAVRASKADRNRFLEMLFVAQEENPGARILIKTHPETQQGLRNGFFTNEDLRDNIQFFDGAVSPWHLLSGAIGVYTVSSGMGFEAIIAGHKPRVFGQPFYAGWGLTVDEFPVTRRQRKLTRAQLFAGAMMLYPTWYDAHRDCLCDLEVALHALMATTRSWREDHAGWVASGMRLWKRHTLQSFFGQHKRLRFEEDAKRATALARPRMVWAGKAGPAHKGAARVEDGFLRSRGLGAELVPPVSLVVDDLGIYYDASAPSRLEAMIAARQELRPDQIRRAERLIQQIVNQGLTKYNLSGEALDLPDGERVLVVGQVEDDASIRLGADEIRTNTDLIAAARAAHPQSYLIYKPHPDVEAGLRPGEVSDTSNTDLVARNTDLNALLKQVDRLWTMTSLSGFEALLRGVEVTTLGAPFYAGWGLTDDRGTVPERRKTEVSLAGLVHATLIDYPRYRDPLTGQPCPVEVIAERLSTGHIPHPGLLNRLLSKAQGALASHAYLWRRDF